MKWLNSGQNFKQVFVLSASCATSNLKSELRWRIWNIRVVKGPAGCGRNYSRKQKIVIKIITVLQTKFGFWKRDGQCLWPVCDGFVPCPGLLFTHMKSHLCPYAVPFSCPHFPWALSLLLPFTQTQHQAFAFTPLRHPRAGTWHRVLDLCLSLKISAPASGFLPHHPPCIFRS